MSSSRPINRREFLRLSMAAVVGTALGTGCAAPLSPSPTATPATPTTVTFLWQRLPKMEVTAFQAVIKAFEDRNPQIKVTVTNPSNTEFTPDVLASGRPIDLFEWGAPTEFAAKGMVVPLDNLLSRSKVVGKGKFLDASLKAGSWQGKLYGLPALSHFTNLTTVANVDLFLQNGLKVPGDVPATFEDALRQNTQYTKLDQSGSIDTLWYAVADYAPAWLAAAYGTRVYDEDNAVFRFDDPTWRDIFSHILAWYDAFGIEKLQAYFGKHMFDPAEPGCATCTGKLAVFDLDYVATTQLPKTAPGRKFHYTWHLVPNSRRGRKVQLVGGSHVAIPKASKSQDEAWRFAEHLVSDESVKTLFEGCGFLLATKPLLADPDWVVDIGRYPDVAWHLDSIRQADEVRSPAACPVVNSIWEVWGRQWQAITTKQTTVEQALSDLQKECTAKLAAALKT